MQSLKIKSSIFSLSAGALYSPTAGRGRTADTLRMTRQTNFSCMSVESTEDLAAQPRAKSCKHLTQHLRRRLAIVAAVLYLPMLQLGHVKTHSTILK